MRLSRALREKWPQYEQRHEKVILQRDNAQPHVAKPVKPYQKTLKWEVLPHPPYCRYHEAKPIKRLNCLIFFGAG